VAIGEEGLQDQGPLVAAHRLLGALELAQDHPEGVEVGGVGGVEPDGPHQEGNRFGAAPLLVLAGGGQVGHLGPEGRMLQERQGQGEGLIAAAGVEAVEGALGPLHRRQVEGLRSPPVGRRTW